MGQSLILEDVQPGRLDPVTGAWRRAEESDRRWTIRFPVEKLDAKYESGPSLLFDHYVFNLANRCPNELTVTDMVAVDRLMGGNLGAKKLRWKIIRDERLSEANKLLARTPASAHLGQGQHYPAVQATLDALVGEEVGLAIASKLLSVKRPYLVPMFDSRLLDALDLPGAKVADVPTLLDRLHVIQQRNLETLSQLQSHVHAKFGVPISHLRVLDHLIWFDWHLDWRPDLKRAVVINFEDWTFDPNDPTRGVARQI